MSTGKIMTRAGAAAYIAGMTFEEIANMDFSQMDATVSVTYIVSNSDTEKRKKE